LIQANTRCISLTFKKLKTFFSINFLPPRDLKNMDDYTILNNLFFAGPNLNTDNRNILLNIMLRFKHQIGYSKPMPWIGIYIAAASLFCILAMVADLIHGLKNRKLWFPCKTFTLNAASLTVIAVAMKLPVDLSNPMRGVADQMAKIGSMAFMCTMMANLLPSLATMNGKELLTNIIALDILVITLIVNVCIQIYTGVIGDTREFSDWYSTLCIVMASFCVAMLLILLIIHTCSGLTILKSKQIIELKYQAGHETALKDLDLQQCGRLTVEKLKKHVKNYWNMARTGNPQFVTACSATTSASGVICVVSTALHLYLIIFIIKYRAIGDHQSDYNWSITAILIIQSIGSLLGTMHHCVDVMQP
jgi:hypothetical protein